MISFKDFINEVEIDEPAPIDPTTGQPVDAQLWANLRYRELWKQGNRPTNPAQQGTAPNLSQTTASPSAMQQKPILRAGIGSLNRQIPGRYDSNVANDLPLAMSPAGSKTYKYYWNKKEGKVKLNPYHPDNALR